MTTAPGRVPMGLRDAVAGTLRPLLRSLHGIWLGRFLNLPRCEQDDGRPGVVMIQIDGLSMPQFERALAEGRLPFIRTLMNRDGYSKVSFYSGLPSATPAVQAELFYGARGAVPAFEFYDRASGAHHVMVHPASANTVGRSLRKTGTPLLQGGSSYANIYSGGARTARYCAETMNLQSLVDAANPMTLAVLLVRHIGKICRIAGYACLELVLAIGDFFSGLVKGNNVVKELKFVPTRLFGCIVLRELIRLRTKMDVDRGVPIVSANFMGYDEQAHRRGPASAFAHWSLKGIDGVVRDIHRAAMRSQCRTYRVFVYSDHGQESVESYDHRSGKPLKQAVHDVFDEQRRKPTDVPASAGDNAVDYLHRRVVNFLSSGERMVRSTSIMALDAAEKQLRITTMGPLGHIYLPECFPGRRDRCAQAGSGPVSDPGPAARKLQQQAHIPLVLYSQNGIVFAVNDAGTHELIEHRKTVLGPTHPFLRQTAEDLSALCLHPNAGDFVISGWHPERTPVSFSIENGAHGGPGKDETHGIALLPPDVNHAADFLRPMELRQSIQRCMDSVPCTDRPCAAQSAK